MFWDDTRGQSVQVGVIILFSFAIIAFTSYQAVIVPQQNQQVEFDHSQNVQSDLIDLRNSIVRAGNGEQSGATTVTLGTEYPARLFAINAPPPSGRLSTTESRPMSINGGTNLGSICPDADAETVGVEYEPSYSYYNNAPTTVHESTMVYNKFGSDVTVESAPRLLIGLSDGVSDNNIINLIQTKGDIGISRTGSVTVDTYSGMRDSAQDVNVNALRIPTSLESNNQVANTWGEVYDSSNIDSLDSVSFDGSNSEVVFNFATDTRFTLVCSGVGLDQSPPGGFTNPAIVVDDDSSPSNPTQDFTYNGDIEAADGSGGDTGIKFSMSNDYNQQLTINEVTINPDLSGNPRLSDPETGTGQWESELYIDSTPTPGVADIPNGQSIPDSGLVIDLSDSNQNSNANAEAVVDPGTSPAFYIYEFTNNGGNGISMTGKSIVITVSYTLEDGTTSTTEIDTTIS